MASITAMILQSKPPMLNKPQFAVWRKTEAQFVRLPISSFSLRKSRINHVMVSGSMAAKVGEKSFVDEMTSAAMKLHSKDESEEGEREPDGPPTSQLTPRLPGYLKFLVDSALVYKILEMAVDESAFSEYAELRNTGLERSEKLARDLEWFKQQGHTIPQPSSLGVNLAQYLDQLSLNNPQAFVCHFFMIYFGQTAGGKAIGRKVEKIVNKELEFYKYDGDISHIKQNVRDKLNRVGERWSREEKDHCLKEAEKSIKAYGDIVRLIFS